MVERVAGTGDRLADAARPLHDFNREYDEASPPPGELAARLAELVGDQPAVRCSPATGTAVRQRGADHAFLVTSEEDVLAQRLHEAAGFRRTEGEGGPLMLAYEREL